MFENIREMIANLNFDTLLGQDLEAMLGEGRYIVYTVIFLGILVAFEGLSQLLARGENRTEAINRRIKMRSQGKSGDEILAILKPAKKKGLLGNLPFVGDLGRALTSVGFAVAPEVFVGACVIGFFVTGMAGSQVINPLIAFGSAALLFLIAPFVVLGGLQKRRKAQLVKQLPDALDLMSRGLQVGHPVNTTLQSVADEMPDPIGTEFGIVVDQVAYGDELTAAISEMADRLDEEDVSYLSVAISMQHGSGGDLSRVLSTLSRVIRVRSKLRRKVKAISSEGRMTAYILSSLPLAIAGVMAISSPTYYGEVMDYPEFWPVMSAIGVAVVLNALVMFRLVNFRI